jgi:hypothetical protein
LRFDQILEILRSRSIAEGWSLDEVQAARARRYFDTRSTGDEAAVVDFIGDHGQSLDWVLCGDPVSMVTMGASHSKRAVDCAKGTPDPIFAAIARYDFAQKAEIEAINATENFERPEGMPPWEGGVLLDTVSCDPAKITRGIAPDGLSEEHITRVVIRYDSREQVWVRDKAEIPKYWTSDRQSLSADGDARAQWIAAKEAEFDRNKRRTRDYSRKCGRTAAMRAMNAAGREAIDSWHDLLDTEPTTRQGLQAMLRLLEDEAGSWAMGDEYAARALATAAAALEHIAA